MRRIAYGIAYAGFASAFLAAASLAAAPPKPVAQPPSAEQPPAAASVPAQGWQTFPRPGKFITALCATKDALWIGTEDKGCAKPLIPGRTETGKHWPSPCPRER